MSVTNQHLGLKITFWGMWLMVFLTACTIFPTPTPQPTNTPLPPTVTPTPTLTPTPLPPVLFPEYEPITSENFQKLYEVAHIQSYGQINDVALAPDGQTVAIAATSGLYFYDTQTGEAPLKIGSDYERIAFSADGSLLATGSRSLITVNSLEGGQLTTKYRLDEVPLGYEVNEIKFSLDGQQLFVHSIYWGYYSICEIPVSHYGIYDLSKSPPENHNLKNNVIFETQECHLDNSYTRFTTDGKFLLYVPDMSTAKVILIEAATGKIIEERYVTRFKDKTHLQNDYHFFDISPDGSQLAIWSENNPESNPITIVDFENNEVISSSAWPIAFFMDSTRQVRRLIPQGGESHLSLWENNQLICEIEPIYYEAVDPTHRYIVTLDGYFFTVWDMTNCQEMAKIPEYFNNWNPSSAWVKQEQVLLISLDGRYIAFLAGEELHLWQFNGETWLQIPQIVPPQLQDVSHISSIAFVPHSHILALQTETEPLFFDVEQWEMVEADIDPLLFDYPEDIVSADKNLTVVFTREAAVFLQTEGHRYLGYWPHSRFTYGVFTPDNRLFITINWGGDLVVYGVRKQE